MSMLERKVIVDMLDTVTNFIKNHKTLVSVVIAVCLWMTYPYYFKHVYQLGRDFGRILVDLFIS